MTTIRTSLKKPKKLLLFVMIIFLTGLLSGATYYSKLQANYQEELEYIITNMNFAPNNIITHCLFLALICFSSIFLLGPLVNLFFIFYEAMSISLVTTIFLKIYGLKGLIFSIIYNILFKGIYLLLLLFILISICNLTKALISIIILKKDNNLKGMIINSFFKIIKISFIIIIFDIFLKLFGDNIIEIFTFLIAK